MSGPVATAEPIHVQDALMVKSDWYRANKIFKATLDQLPAPVKFDHQPCPHADWWSFQFSPLPLRTSSEDWFFFTRIRGFRKPEEGVAVDCCTGGGLVQPIRRWWGSKVFKLPVEFHPRFASWGDRYSGDGTDSSFRYIFDRLWSITTAERGRCLSQNL